MSDKIINRVAKSSLQQIHLDEWMPDEHDVVSLDISEFLENQIVFREKYFREQINNFDFSGFTGKYVNITNHQEAIVPLWAYMILSAHLQHAQWVGSCAENESHNEIIRSVILKKDMSEYQNKPVIVKGCGKYDFSPEVYLLITRKLLPVAKSVMYGEACSSVPVFKKSSV